MTKYTKGQRVNTPHGAGEVAGFEQFDKYGMSLPPTDLDTSGWRVLVKLDNPSNWLSSSVSQSHPHYWREELTTA